MKRLDGNVQSIDPKDGNYHHQGPNTASLRVSTKSFYEGMDDHFDPGQCEQGNRYSQRTDDNERSPASPVTLALITQHAGQGLNDRTTEWGRYPDQRRQRL